MMVSAALLLRVVMAMANGVRPCLSRKLRLMAGCARSSEMITEFWLVIATCRGVLPSASWGGIRDCHRIAHSPKLAVHTITAGYSRYSKNAAKWACTTFLLYTHTWEKKIVLNLTDFGSD